MQPVGLWQRQHAAAPRKQENSSLFPPQVYPFPAPEPACAVMLGVSQHLLLPMSARKHKTHTKEKSKTTPSPPYLTEIEREKETRPSLLLHGPVLVSSHLLHLDLRYALLLDARGHSLRNLPLLFPSWWGR